MSFDPTQLIPYIPVAGDLVSALVRGIEGLVDAHKSGDPAAALAALNQAIAEVQPLADALPTEMAGADAAGDDAEDAKFPRTASPLAPTAAAVVDRLKSVAAALSAAKPTQ